MAGEDTFWRRYTPLVRRIRREYPGFWEELREMAEQHQGRMYTTHGARVRDWPRTQDAGVQAGPSGTGRRSVAVQVDRTTAPEPPPRPTLRVLASPRNDPRPDDDQDPVEWEPEVWDDLQPIIPRHDPWGEDEEDDGALDGGEDRPVARGGGPGCWNCGSRAHRYSACPQPRRAFCYGCGREGVTLRDCVRCAEGWRRLGPYHPGRGHDQRRD